MGVFLFSVFSMRSTASLPHARGGVSGEHWYFKAPQGSSPRPGGCFWQRAVCDAPRFVFPTPVGVFLKLMRLCFCQRRLPHARGGVSPAGRLWALCTGSSPRPWGCFLMPHALCDGLKVFPTPVGVFPKPTILRATSNCLPHARGGVSTCIKRRMSCTRSSPRPWGCFLLGCIPLWLSSVFPTPVGVFPDYYDSFFLIFRLPHARGGVSTAITVSISFLSSSPRPWGCFWGYLS